MQLYQELFTTDDKITKDQWSRLYKTLVQQLGIFSKFQIVVQIQDNVVRFFIGADKDISQISNNIDMGILRTVDKAEIKFISTNNKEKFFQFATGGNILDSKERSAIKNKKQLEQVVLNIRSVDSSKSLTKVNLYFKDDYGQYSVAKKLLTFFPAHLLEIDFATNTNYMKKSSPRYLSLEKTLNLFDTNESNAIFSINTFPYFSSPRYLNLYSYEFNKHSFIIGSTGSGKSKLIELYIKRLASTQEQINYRVIVLDPHDNIRHDLSNVDNSKVVNFANETTQLFGGEEVQTDISAATELTTSLIKSLLEDQFNARLERVLRFSLFVLFVAQTMSLDYLKRFLTDLELRSQILKHTNDHIPSNIRQFFLTDFNDIKTSHYNEAILPIVSLVDEMQLQPALVNESDQSLARIIQNNFLTIFSLNKVSMGDKVVKTISGLLISQIFLLAQARAFNEHLILVVDEVSIVQTPVLASILSEARKFNLSVILTQQYFGQIEKDLRAAIFANTYNYYVFRISEEDAMALSGNLTMEIPKEIIESEAKKGLKEDQIKIRYLTELHPRECILRLSANGQVLPCFKASTVEVASSGSQKNKNSSNTNQPKTTLKKFIEQESITFPTLESTQTTKDFNHNKKSKELLNIPSNDILPVKTPYNSKTNEGQSYNTDTDNMNKNHADQSKNFELDPSLRKNYEDKTSSDSNLYTLNKTQPTKSMNVVDLKQKNYSPDSINNVAKIVLHNQVLSTHAKPGMSLSELIMSQSSESNKKRGTNGKQ